MNQLVLVRYMLLFNCVLSQLDGWLEPWLFVV